MDELINEALAQFPDPETVFTVTQGHSTIPLPGIDVPFHSNSLLSEVPRFREYLLKILNPKTIDIPLLENKYVPNLTAKPFQVTIEYANLITGSMKDSILETLLKEQSLDPVNIPEDKQLLAYYILVELLAFQFASPVRWIETQDYFFKNNVETLIEIGPVATLKGTSKLTETSRWT